MSSSFILHYYTSSLYLPPYGYNAPIIAIRLSSCLSIQIRTINRLFDLSHVLIAFHVCTQSSSAFSSILRITWPYHNNRFSMPFPHLSAITKRLQKHRQTVIAISLDEFHAISQIGILSANHSKTVKPPKTSNTSQFSFSTR